MTALEYQLGKRVARGGFGTVYQATLSDGRPVAVKRLHAKYRDDQLLGEAHVLASLEHPNIVKFFGVHQHRDNLELVMEWVGPKLTRLQGTGELPLGVVRHIMVELLSSLDYLHGQKKLNHRDLSPRNVLLATDGSVKLADFGLARQDSAPRTTTALKGSPPYMSPEQANGKKVDARSDLFALGVVFYELLTGTLPFQSAPELAKYPLVSPVRTLRPAVPRKLADVVARLLEYDRAKRYPSAQAVLDALGDSPDERALGRADLALLMCERGLIPTPSRITSGWRFMSLAAVAAIALMGVIGVYRYGPFASGASPRAGTAERERMPEHHELDQQFEHSDSQECVGPAASATAVEHGPTTTLPDGARSAATPDALASRKQSSSRRAASRTEAMRFRQRETAPAVQPQPETPGGSYEFSRPMGGSHEPGLSGENNSDK